MQWRLPSGAYTRLVFFFSLLLPLTPVSETILYSQTNPVWQHCYGGTDDDWVNSLKTTNDGGCIFAGMTRSYDGDVSGNHGGMDAWVVKLDPYHQIEWQRCFGGELTDEAFDVQQTLDGGYVVVGGTALFAGDTSVHQGQEDFFVLKLAPDGGTEWVKTYGGSKDDRATSVIQTPDGGYLVSGYILSDDGDVLFNHGAADIWVIKLSPEGELQWQKPMGGTDWDIPEALIQTKGYGFIVAGHSFSDDGEVTCSAPGNHIWVAKVRPTWTIEWNVCLPGTTAHSVCSTLDSAFLVGGETFSGNGVIYKVDDEGNVDWSRDLAGAVYSVRQTNSGEILAAGQGIAADSCRTGISVTFAKLDTGGTILFQKTFGGLASDWARAVTRTFDGSYLLAGGSMSDDCDVKGNHNAYLFSDTWLMICDQGIPVEEYYSSPGFTVHPNPALYSVCIETSLAGFIGLYTSSGQKLATFRADGRTPVTADLTGYRAGLYIFVQAETGQSVKLVKE